MVRGTLPPLLGRLTAYPPAFRVRQSQSPVGSPVFLCVVVSDSAKDKKEDDPVDSSSLPDLDYESKNADRPVFAVLKNPEDTWDKIFCDVKKAMVIRGHNCVTRIRSIESVRLYLHTNPPLPRFHVSSVVGLSPHRDGVGDWWGAHHRVYIFVCILPRCRAQPVLVVNGRSWCARIRGELTEHRSTPTSRSGGTRHQPRYERTRACTFSASRKFHAT